MRLHPGVGIFGALLFFSLAQCSSTYADACQSSIDCEGGNDKDVDACIAEARGAENRAEAYDCGDQFEAVADCTKESGTCKEEEGRKSFSAGDACKAKNEALSACVNAATCRVSPKWSAPSSVRCTAKTIVNST